MTRLSKYILLAILLAIPASSFSGGRLDYLKGVVSSCVETTGCNTEDDIIGINATNAHQVFKALGAETTICQVDVKLNKNTATRTVHIEVWNSGKTIQYGDNSDGIEVSSVTSAVYSFTWSGTKPTVPNADFEVYILQDAGIFADTKISVYTADPNCYEDTNYDYWYGGNDRNMDAYVRLYEQ